MAKPYKVKERFVNRFGIIGPNGTFVGDSFSFKADAERACRLANIVADSAMDRTIKDLREALSASDAAGGAE